MKNLLSITLILSVISVYGQWSSGNPVYFNDGNVGIGTSTPGVWFGSKTLEFSDWRPVLKLTSTSNNGLSTMVFTNTNVNASNHVGEFHLNYQYNQANNDKSFLRFSSYPATEILTLHANGNVGIGTSDPSSLFHIQSSAGGWLQNIRGQATQSGEFVGLKITSGYLNETAKWAGIAAVAVDQHSNNTALSLYASASEKVRIDGTSGNVGIGTNSPSAKLEIGTIALNEPAFKAMDFQIAPNLGGGGWNSISQPGDIGLIFKSGKSLVIAPHSPSTSGLRITEAGNIGIGVANPSEILQIGNVGANNNKIAIPGVYNFENFKIGQFGNGSSGIEMVNHTDLNNSFGIKISTNVDQAAGLQIQYAPAASSYGSLQYTTGFFMGYDGRVGIGTINPDTKLAVKGTIHAEEVKVDLSVPGPDYVFEKDYNLMSLDEIKAYIEKHKHLPEVPSAKEMETNGVNLSEMNMILLKKVEELTLYVIELKKENTEIKSEINRLKK